VVVRMMSRRRPELTVAVVEAHRHGAAGADVGVVGAAGCGAGPELCYTCSVTLLWN
jgi:hypothetical protein